MRVELWRAALYIRLSREDGDKGESESIENQRLLLWRFAKEQGFFYCTEYVDEGYSGTSFARPEFMRMIKDIKNGNINCVIVKDLSRFGREYIQTGYYLEQVFPLMGVRFIAVNDMVDSFNQGGLGQSSLLLSFKNIMNDEYARDISVKVKSALRAKKHAGIFACPFAPYGYRRDKNTSVGISVFKEEAVIVKLIYKWEKQGIKIKKIAELLNQIAVPSPAQSKSYYSKYQNPNVIKKEWGYQSVYRIINNPCYLGDFTLAKTTTISHKLSKKVTVSPNNRIYINNPSLAIISEKEQKKEIDTKQKRRKRKKSPVQQYLYCGRCMSKMHIKYGGEKAYYVCSKYKKEGPTACSSHSIIADELDINIYMVIFALMEINVNDARIFQKMNKYTNNYYLSFDFERINCKENKKIGKYFTRKHKNNENNKSIRTFNQWIDEISTEYAENNSENIDNKLYNIEKNIGKNYNFAQIYSSIFAKIIDKIQVQSSDEVIFWLNDGY